MAQAQGGRDFIKPETVVLNVRTNKAGTRKPIDVTTVVLTRIETEGDPVVLPEVDFERIGEGDYTLSIASDDLEVGTYQVAATVTGPKGVVVIPDTFVLRAA